MRLAIGLCLTAWGLWGQATFQRVITANANTFFVGYIAPSDAACTEQASSDPGFATFIVNQTGNTGGRSRYFVVSGLTANLTYYFRTDCGGVVSDQFKTPLAVGSAATAFWLTARPMPIVSLVSGLNAIEVFWGSTPTSLNQTVTCDCLVSGCTMKIGEGLSNVFQDSTYYMQYKWKSGTTVLGTSSVIPLTVGEGANNVPTPTVPIYTSPHCIAPGSPVYNYNSGTPIGASWACSSYPTTTPPALPAAGCPPTTNTTNACTVGYNTIVSDADTGNPILRVTESGSLNNTTSGNRFYTPAAGWAPVWNSDTTKFLLYGDNNSVYVVGFNPNSMSLTGTSQLLPGAGRLSWNFSSTDPDLLYFMLGNVLKSRVVSTGTETTIVDFSTLPSWVSGQNVLQMWIGGPTACAYTMLGSGGNGTGKVVACYNITTAQSWVIDTNLGTINGVALGGTGTNTAGITTLHEITPSPDGTSVAIDTGYGSDSGCDTSDNAAHAQLIVNLTTGVAEQLGRYCYLSHWAMGFGAMYQSVGARPILCTGSDSRGMARRPFLDANPSPFPEVSGCYNNVGNGSSIHLSWLNNTAGVYQDMYPVFIDAWNDGNGYQCHQCNEVAAYNAATIVGTATSYRFMQTWKTGSTDTPAGCSDYISRSSQVSRDGRYVLFLSDWKGGTGTGGSCPGGRRTDVFIGRLN